MSSATFWLRLDRGGVAVEELASVSLPNGKAAIDRPGVTATIPRVNTHFGYLRIECSP